MNGSCIVSTALSAEIADSPSSNEPAHNTRRACSICGGYLSRYSQGSRCAACARSGFIPEAVWADPAVAAALQHFDFGALFRLLRGGMGMSQNELLSLIHI